MAVGKFIHIPLLIGANSDEGTSFGVSGLDNETAIFNNLLVYRAYAIPPPPLLAHFLSCIRMILCTSRHTTSQMQPYFQAKDFSGGEIVLLQETLL